MALLSTKNNTKTPVRLTRDDWIEQALEVLVQRGIHAVQITFLSKCLGVTRGSFYWHFESRESLLDALIAEWRARNSNVMIETLSNSEMFDKGILELFSVWLDQKQFDPKLDQSIRDWSRCSDQVMKMVAAEDNSRVLAIANFFEKHGYEATNAFVRARVIYFTQISYYSLHVSETLEERLSYLPAYFNSFTGREIDASTCKDFITRQLTSDMT